MGSIYKLLRLTSREKEFVLEGFQLQGKENLMINSQKGQLSLKKSRRRWLQVWCSTIKEKDSVPSQSPCLADLCPLKMSPGYKITVTAPHIISLISQAERKEKSPKAFPHKKKKGPEPEPSVDACFTYLYKNYLLFIWNSNLTGCPVFLSTKSGNF